MAPSPENDNAPKAPDKGGDRSRAEAGSGEAGKGPEASPAPAPPENKEASVCRLDDKELKNLLDEAITYKSPKDRHGKSQLFQNLLEKAEEDDRKARATSASGSELVRYYNTTATHRTRHRREPNSVSESLTHGGSLNNLAKEELYEAARLHKPKTVSSRQRQGGSLPCNVNAGVTTGYDKQFFEEAAASRRKQEERRGEQPEYTAIDMESERLLDHDELGREYAEQAELEEVVHARIPRIPVKFTSRFNLEIGGGGSAGSGVDEAVSVSALDRAPTEKAVDNELVYKPVETITTTTYPHYSLLMQSPGWSFIRKPVEDKKVDENGNALGQAAADAKKNKKKKQQTDKNVVVLEARDMPGHRADIIDDLDKLVQFIKGSEGGAGTSGKSSARGGKSGKQLHSQKHLTGTAAASGGDDKNGKKQRVRPKAAAKGAEKLKKSSSLEEISTTKMDEFDFGDEAEGSGSERGRERRSWGNSDQLPLQSLQLYANASAENLETADFRVVTKKKKSKKHRNSSRPAGGCESVGDDYARTDSPKHHLRRKATRSVPHSEKSNDSSDVDSVHSLPVDAGDRCLNDIDGLNLPISYADIAKNSSVVDRRPPSERKKSTDQLSSPPGALLTAVNMTDDEKTTKNNKATAVSAVVATAAPPPLEPAQPVVENNVVAPPQPKPFSADIQDIQSWPSIHHNSNHHHHPQQQQQAKVAQPRQQPVPGTNKVLGDRTNRNIRQPKVVNVYNNINNNNMKNMQQMPNKVKETAVPNSTPMIMNNMAIPLPAAAMHMEPMCVNNVLPPDVPDVQTIEKLHMKQLQALQHQQGATAYVCAPMMPANHHHMPISVGYVAFPLTTVMTGQPLTMAQAVACGGEDETAAAEDRNNCAGPVPDNDCDSERRRRTSGGGNGGPGANNRPAVVIMSGDGNDVSGLTFGFDINEQLLSDDVCDNFVTRFAVPDVEPNESHDRTVSFIANAWEEAANDSKVRYFSDQL